MAALLAHLGPRNAPRCHWICELVAILDEVTLRVGEYLLLNIDVYIYTVMVRVILSFRGLGPIVFGYLK